MSAVRFTIRAPLASWATTGTYYRPTDALPSWSAMTGLVGAALGWDRGDERLVRLAHDYAMAATVRHVGERMTDYHTVQSPHVPALGKKPPRTRSEELKAVKPDGSPNTTITQREYIQDADYGIVIAPVVDAPVVSPEEIRRALANPAYPLYAGRRSCLLGAILAKTVTGSSVEEWLPDCTHWDARLSSSLPHSLVRQRRDLLVQSTEPRRFTVREERVR